MEATIIYWGYIGIMEERMETTEIIGVILDAQKYPREGCMVFERSQPDPAILYPHLM